MYDSTIRFKHQSNPQFLMLWEIWFWWWNIALPDTARPWPLRSGEEPDFGPTNQVIQRLGHAKCLNRCLVLNLLIILKPYETIKFWTQQGTFKAKVFRVQTGLMGLPLWHRAFFTKRLVCLSHQNFRRFPRNHQSITCSNFLGSCCLADLNLDDA